MRKLHQLFPSTIYQTRILPTHHKLNTELLKECRKFSEIDQQGIAWSKKNYAGGYTSYGSLSKMYQISPYFDDLKKLIDRQVHQYIKDLEMDCKPKDIQMCSLWINVMPKGTTHTMHIHPLSVISGTYYLQIPKDTRGLKFEDPRMVNFMASPPRKVKASRNNQRFIEMTPHVGEIILFESWIRHEVPPNPSKTDRISISFNYDWV